MQDTLRSKFFIDTEFSERGPGYPVQLISIGIKAEDGREFYAVSQDFDADGCNDWVKANVLPKLCDGPPAHFHGSLSAIAERVREFIGDCKPEFWGYYADYDWIVFCQMFGTMMDLPKGWPMYCRDLKQLCDSLGNPKLPEQLNGEHNALADAIWNKAAFDFLVTL